MIQSKCHNTFWCCLLGLQQEPGEVIYCTKLQTHNCLKEISMRKKNWSQVPDGRLTPGQTGRLTVGRKLTATAIYHKTMMHTVTILMAIKWRNVYISAHL
jgi:hypothetical protein